MGGEFGVGGVETGEMEYDEALERALDERSDSGYDFSGLKERNEIETKVRVLEFRSSSNSSVSFFSFNRACRVDRIILAEQTSDDSIWSCYPPS